MTDTTPPSDWWSEFDKKFPCIDPNCDNNGVTWHVISGYDSYGEPSLEQEQLQCQYCHEQRFPHIEFIATQSAAHEMKMKEVVEKTLAEMESIATKNRDWYTDERRTINEHVLLFLEDYRIALLSEEQ